MSNPNGEDPNDESMTEIRMCIAFVILISDLIRHSGFVIRHLALKLFLASLVNLVSTSRMLNRGRFVRYV